METMENKTSLGEKCCSIVSSKCHIESLVWCVLHSTLLKLQGSVTLKDKVPAARTGAEKLLYKHPLQIAT